MDPKKNVAIIGTTGLPANYGGFETMVNYLTLNLNSEFYFTVYCQRTDTKNQLKEFNNCKLVYLPFKANGAQSILYDVVAITKSWFKFDTLLILGTPGCLILPFLRLLKKTKTVVNFGGLEWKRDKWPRIIRWYLKVTEVIAVRYATVIVADNQHFCNYIKSQYQKESVLIEYGGDHTSKLKPSHSLIEKYPFLKENYDVSVSRAQPDNNLHMVLEAYKCTPKRNLVLISNYNKFEYGKELKEKYNSYPNLFLQDAIYDLHELDTIRSNASIYVHSHSFCGTAPSLVEAMYLQLPIIAFDTETNHFTTEERAFYFKDEDELKYILNNLNSGRIILNSKHMRHIAEDRYFWSRISNLYASVF